MATEIFRLFKGVWACVIILEKQPFLSLLGDQKFSIAIQWWGMSDSGGKKFGHPPHINCDN
jgi:hypothetical protein